MREVVIVSAVRTAIGSFGGSLKDVPSSELGAIVIKEAVNRAGIKPELVEEVVMGNVIQAAQGQNVARQAAVKAGLPVEVPAMTINKVCGSGLRCVALAAQMIKAGDCDVVVAGGMENMSAAPYAVPGARWGQRMGDGKIVDTTELDAALEKAKLLKDTTEDHKKVLIIQAKALIREEDVKAEEDRIKSITGMRVCIINSRYEVVGIETGLNNG